jgi:hypothetical protein
MNKIPRLLIAVALLLGAAFPAAAQRVDSLTLRLNAGAGYTIIDLPTALEWDADYFEDWDEVDIKVNLQGLFLDFGRVSLGAEIGYNRLYYYYVVVPWVPSNLYYEGSVGPVNISVLGAVEVARNFFIQAAAGAYIFSDGVTAGLCASAMYTVPIGASMAIPIAANAEVVFGSGTPVAVGLTVGFQYTFNLAR